MIELTFDEIKMRMDVLFPMIGMNKCPPFDLQRGPIGLSRCSEKELFMRREYQRLNGIMGRGET